MHPAIPVTAIIACAALEITALLTHQDGAMLGLALTIIGGIAGFTLSAILPTTQAQSAIRKVTHFKQPSDKLPF